ncbi:MAG TPA: hypothetical protein GX405_07730 [Rhizobiales bacterium]|nr:hypothetical protein [Hyphomicrobiales bacterium]
MGPDRRDWPLQPMVEGTLRADPPPERHALALARYLDEGAALRDAATPSLRRAITAFLRAMTAG